MTDKALQAYLKKNEAYLKADDRIASRADGLVTATQVAARKAKAFTAARDVAAQLEQAVSETSLALQRFPKGPMGLTPDEVKRSPEWLTAYRNFNFAFQAARKHSRTYTKSFAEELRHERHFRRAAGLAPR
jgi:hypothetical protein